MLRDGPVGLVPRRTAASSSWCFIARAIASECPILALDEPSAGSDLHNQARILSLVRRLVDDGMAVLLTTHHPDHSLYLADSVVLMTGDGDVRTGVARDLLTDETLSAVYGIEVRTVSYEQDGNVRRAIITRDDDPGVRDRAQSLRPAGLPHPNLGD